MDPVQAFGHVLRAVRKEAKLTQEQLALDAGIERNFVSLIERGINQPSLRVIFKISIALGTLPSILLQRVERALDDTT